MRIAEIIGSVTLSRRHPALTGASFRLAIPMDLESLVQNERSSADELVVYDEHGAGIGQRIALSEGGEAALPFRPELKPVDAYNSAILDTIEVRNLTQQ